MGQLYTTYWIVVVWRRDRGHLLILIVINLLLLWALNRVKVRIKFFWCVTWPLDRCFTWLCGWALFILSHQSAKFGIRRPCESGCITSLMCQMTTWFVCHVTLWVGSSIRSQHAAKFRVHRPCESGIIMFFICQVTTISKCHVALWVWVWSSQFKLPFC